MSECILCGLDSSWCKCGLDEITPVPKQGPVSTLGEYSRYLKKLSDKSVDPSQQDSKASK